MTGYQSKKDMAQDKLTVDRTQVEKWLEALKDIDALHHSQEPESVDAQKAIADMWQALAQPEQDAYTLRDHAFNYRNAHTAEAHEMWKKLEQFVDCKTKAAQRTWVGLTDEELSILGEEFTHPDEGIDEVDFGMEIQRILKEKNNG